MSSTSQANRSLYRDTLLSLSGQLVHVLLLEERQDIITCNQYVSKMEQEPFICVYPDHFTKMGLLRIALFPVVGIMSFSEYIDESHRPLEKPTPRYDQRSMQAMATYILDQKDPSETVYTLSLNHKEIPNQIPQKDREILIALCQGFSTFDICEKHYYSEATVRTYIHKWLDHFKAENRIKMIIEAIRHGYISVTSVQYQ